MIGCDYMKWYNVNKKLPKKTGYYLIGENSKCVL